MSTGKKASTALLLAVFGQLAIAPGAGAAEEAGPAPALLSGTIGLLVVLVITFAALLVLFHMLLGARARAGRDTELLRTVRGAQATGDDEGHSSRPVATSLLKWVPERIMDSVHRMADGKPLGQRLDKTLERAGIAARPGEALVLGALAAGAGALVMLLLSQNLLGALLGGAMVAAICQMWLSLKARKRTSRVRSQLPDVLMILASSLRAGQSFLQALDSVAGEISEPAKHEFERALAEIKLGRPVDEALEALADRVDSLDFSWTVLALNIQRDVGGNLAEILDTVSGTLRERDDIRRQVDVLSAEGKLSALVLSILPFLLVGYMSIVTPDTIGLLFTTRLGLVMLVGSLTLLATGILWIRKMVKIDV